MRLAVLLCAALPTLAGCGADAPPLTPEKTPDAKTGTGITVSGDARIGVTATF